MEDMNRYCSNVVELTINTAENTATTTTPPKTIVTPLTSSLKTTIDSLVVAFMEKLQAKYPNNISSRITLLDTLINKIGTLATGKNASLFTYLKERLQEQADILRLQDLLDI